MWINHSVILFILLFECRVCLCHSGSVSKELQWHPVAVKLKFKLTNRETRQFLPAHLSFCLALCSTEGEQESTCISNNVCHVVATKRVRISFNFCFSEVRPSEKEGKLHFTPSTWSFKTWRFSTQMPFPFTLTASLSGFTDCSTRKHLPCNLMSHYSSTP